MRLLAILAALAALVALPAPAAAQEDENGGFLARKLAESLSGPGREVRISGFRGALSSQATMTALTVADADGVWLRLTGITLDWTRSALLRGGSW